MEHRKHYQHDRLTILVIRGEKGGGGEGGGREERRWGRGGGGRREGGGGGGGRREGEDGGKKVERGGGQKQCGRNQKLAVPTFSSFCLLLARPRFFFRSAFSACSASIIALGVCGGGGEEDVGEWGGAEKEGREDVTNFYYA